MAPLCQELSTLYNEKTENKMKLRKITYLFYPCIILMCGVMFLLSSCIAERTDYFGNDGLVNGNEKEMIINLAVPSAPNSSSRTEEENDENYGIYNLYVLSFQATGQYMDNKPIELFQYGTTATKLDDTSNNWNAKLKLEDFSQTFVMIANVPDGELKTRLDEIIENADEKFTNQDKYKLLGDLQYSVTAKVPDVSQVLIGQSPSTVLQQNSSSQIKVTLSRIGARVNISFGTTDSPINDFVLESVQLRNVQNKGMVMPGELTNTFEKVTKPTLPDSDGNGLYDAPMNIDLSLEELGNPADNKVENKIYLFESGQPEDYPTETSDGKLPDDYRPSMIIGGKYQGGDTRYWRISFQETVQGKEKEFVNILRNHAYSITVVEITGQGYATPDEAMVAPDGGMIQEIVVTADDEISTVASDGKNYIGVEKTKYTVEKKSTVLEMKIIATEDFPWTAELYNEVGEGQETQPDWVHFDADGTTSATSGTGSGKEKPVTLSLHIKDFEGIGERSAKLRLKAGKLVIEDVVITQNDVEPDVLFLEISDNGTLEYDENGNVRFDVPVKFGPENAQLTWKFTSRDDDFVKNNGEYSGGFEGIENGELRIGTTPGNSSNSENYWKIETFAPTPPTPTDGLYTIDTRSAVIELTVKLEGDTRSKSVYIPVKQIKHVLVQKGSYVPETLPNEDGAYPLLSPDGKGNYVQVFSTFPWRMEVKNKQDSIDYIKSITSNKGNGGLKEQYLITPKYKLLENKKEIELQYFSREPYIAENSFAFDKYIYLDQLSQLIDGEHVYSIYGPFSGTLAQLINGEVKGPDGTYLPNRALAEKIFKAKVDLEAQKDQYGWNVGGVKGHHLCKVPYSIDYNFASRAGQKVDVCLGAYKSDDRDVLPSDQVSYYIINGSEAKSTTSNEFRITNLYGGPFDDTKIFMRYRMVSAYESNGKDQPTFNMYYRIPAYGYNENSEELETDYYRIIVESKYETWYTKYAECFKVYNTMYGYHGTKPWSAVWLDYPSLNDYWAPRNISTICGVDGDGNNAIPPVYTDFNHFKTFWGNNNFTAKVYEKSLGDVSQEQFVQASHWFQWVNYGWVDPSSGANIPGTGDTWAVVTAYANYIFRRPDNIQQYSEWGPMSKLAERTYFSNIYFVKCVGHDGHDCPLHKDY